MKECSFVIDSKEHIMDLIIHAAFRDPDVLIQFHKMEKDAIRMFYRLSIPYNEYWGFVSTLPRDPAIQSYTDLIHSKAYIEKMNEINPVHEVELSDAKIRDILLLYNQGIPADYKDIGGRDGHSYVLTIHGKEKRYFFWCFVEPRLKVSANQSPL